GNDRDLAKSELESGVIAAVSGQDYPVFVGEDWICPAKASNTVGDLTNLLLRMGPAVPFVRVQLADRNKRDLRTLHGPTTVECRGWDPGENAREKRTFRT